MMVNYCTASKIQHILQMYKIGLTLAVTFGGKRCEIYRDTLLPIRICASHLSLLLHLEYFVAQF